MKKILFFVLTFFFISYSVHSQDVLGYINSNYSGVTGTDLNPANVVDSRYKIDINFVGLSLSLYNNYVGLKRSALKRNGGEFTAFQDTLFADNYLNVRNNNINKSVYFSNQIYLPSVMISINSKNAFALKSKMRTLFNIDGIEPELATLIYHSLDYPSLWVQRLSNKNLSLQTMTWMEYGATYGHVFKNEGPHFLKAGATVKYLQGLQSIYMDIRNLNYEFVNDTTLSLFHSDVSYGHSTNYEGDNNGFKQSSNPSFGFDIGVVYEWRPDHEKYKYDMDGEKGLYRKDKNKYKLRVGISAVDIGYVKFKKGTYSHNFTADIGLWNLHDFDGKSSVSSFDSVLVKNFVMTSSDKYYKMNLPTAFSLQVDYNIWKDFYGNFTAYWSPRFKKDNEKVHDITAFSLTPRWDHKWFGAFLPVSYDVTGNFKVGLALRAGPLIIGTNSFGPWVTRKDIYGADAYALLKIPIMYGHKKDKDKDGISDKKDKCKEVPGVWEFMGCPDKDGDHVEDKLDACPDEPGIPEFNGCPDKDGDKVIDKEDACPDEPGIAEFKGCPDRDGDKVIDKEDECPDVSGMVEFKGCPDRDGDGVQDKVDLCPDKPGPVSNDGCPEIKLSLIDAEGNKLQTIIANKDGSFTFVELPPDKFVLFKLEGDGTDTLQEIKIIVGGVSKRAMRNAQDNYFRFIILDTDVNKLNRQEEKDIEIKLDEKEAEVLKKAFDNLEFATAKDIIKPSSLNSLDELADLMMKKPNWRLKISGHTDSQGQSTTNLKLSQKRAEAVKKYLMSKGVSPERFKVEWFGSKKPIADNKTEEGRQKNRRVEMLIIE